MSRLISPKLKLIKKGYIGHWCPGCCTTHLIRIIGNVGDLIHSFDYTDEVASFSPSVMIFSIKPRTIAEMTHPVEHIVCHYSLRHGIIQYFNDSLHQYAGKAIELPDFPSAQKEFLNALS